MQDLLQAHPVLASDPRTLAALQARSERDPLGAVYVLILVLGLRKGEVLGLTWDDGDGENCRSAINCNA
ncbi:MAG: hypothetical protein ACRDSR_11180 [Pseudonocardiaceae bacterium]